MKYLAILFSIGLLLGGCGGDKTAENTEPTTDVAPPPTPAAVIDSSTEAYDFGDVESALQLEMIVTTEDLPAGGAIEELRAANKKKLNLMTVNIDDGVPKELTVTVLIKAKSSFDDNFVALRGKVFREIEIGNREEIFTFNTMVDDTFYPIPHADLTAGPFPAQFSTDVLAGLDEIPPTMLVYMVVEAVLVDMSVEKSKIDIATATASGNFQGTLLSNPLRINYTAPVVETPPAPVVVPENTETPPVAESVQEATPAEEAPATQ